MVRDVDERSWYIRHELGLPTISRMLDTNPSFGSWEKPGLYTVFGSEGTGKSFLAANRILEWVADNPNGRALYISSEESDIPAWFTRFGRFYEHANDLISRIDFFTVGSASLDQVIGMVERIATESRRTFAVIDSLDAIRLPVLDEFPVDSGIQFDEELLLRLWEFEKLERVRLASELRNMALRTNTRVMAIFQKRPEYDVGSDTAEYGDVVEKAEDPDESTGNGHIDPESTWPEEALAATNNSNLDSAWLSMLMYKSVVTIHLPRLDFGKRNPHKIRRELAEILGFEKLHVYTLEAEVLHTELDGQKVSRTEVVIEPGFFQTQIDRKKIEAPPKYHSNEYAFGWGLWFEEFIPKATEVSDIVVASEIMPCYEGKISGSFAVQIIRVPDEMSRYPTFGVVLLKKGKSQSFVPIGYAGYRFEADELGQYEPKYVFEDIFQYPGSESLMPHIYPLLDGSVIPKIFHGRPIAIWEDKLPFDAYSLLTGVGRIVGAMYGPEKSNTSDSATLSLHERNIRKIEDNELNRAFGNEPIPEPEDSGIPTEAVYAIDAAKKHLPKFLAEFLETLPPSPSIRRSDLSRAADAVRNGMLSYIGFERVGYAPQFAMHWESLDGVNGFGYTVFIDWQRSIPTGIVLRKADMTIRHPLSFRWYKETKNPAYLYNAGIQVSNSTEAAYLLSGQRVTGWEQAQAVCVSAVNTVYAMGFSEIIVGNDDSFSVLLSPTQATDDPEDMWITVNHRLCNEQPIKYNGQHVYMYDSAEVGI